MTGFAWRLSAALIVLSCPAAGVPVDYNLKDYQTPLTTRVSLPPQWQPGPGPNYQGSLDAYWSVTLSAGETQWVSSTEARAQGAPPDFQLITAPDNCWGMFMGFGLITLTEPMDLGITVTPDVLQSSQLVPAFALYRGWDLGTTASRHLTIRFGEDNPLKTVGLSFVTDSYAENLGTTARKTLSRLPAGRYELFVTSRGNTSAQGAYQVRLEAFPAGSQTDSPSGEGPLCGSAHEQSFPLETAPENLLCRYGKPTTPLNRLKDGRLTWLCAGPGTSRSSARCYSEGTDGKRHQAPLTLDPGNVTLTVEGEILETAQGGSGEGRLRYALQGASHGTQCRLKIQKSSARVRIKGNPGSCRLTARKEADRNYYSIESAPFDVTLRP